jgi:tetratricopeptide (TPR) repeat protein
MGCHPRSDELGGIYEGLGQLAAQLGEWNEAARCWREMAALLPRDEYVWYNLGDALVHAGDYHGAIDALSKDLRRGPKEPACTLYDMASAYYHLGDMRRAKVFCERVLKRAPSDADALALKRELQGSCCNVSARVRRER